MRGRQPYDNNGISKAEYERMLTVSISDFYSILSDLILLEESSRQKRISGKDIEAIRLCACFARAHIDLHLHSK